ncbi:MAG: hypothetical protein ACQKBY_00320, partial [Verrucomicrobiales bacterium]
EARMEVGLEEMKGLFRQTMQEISHRDAALNEKLEKRNEATNASIERVAKSAYEGRGKLWNEVNRQREKIATVETEADVVGKLDKVVDALQAKPQSPRTRKP